MWPVVFFGWHRLHLAFVIILIVWACVAKLTDDYQKSDKLAAYLMIPYLLWVSYAAVLNLLIAFMN